MTDLLLSCLAVAGPAALTAGVAAYFGAYLQEKGRNVATREDLDRVLRAQEEIRAQVTGALWEAQERWRFKADLYTKVLTTLKRIRQPLEIAATKGEWPDPDTWNEIVRQSRELVEPTVVARIWLTDAAVQPLQSFGDRLMKLAREQAVMTEKQVLMKMCELIETDLRLLQETAREDLQLRPPSPTQGA